jgi:serine/threonine protein phosphatase PrpC
MQLEIAMLSKTGGRKVNEDACDYRSAAEVCCCVLSDGLGGHYGGDVASKLVVTSTLDTFRKKPACNQQTVEALLRAGDDAITQVQRQNRVLRQMRATGVILLVDTEGNSAVWGHIGDSRLYGFRHGRIVVQTRDHSVSQSMVEAGYLRPEELRLSPSRNQLLAALGDSKHFEAAVVPAVFPVQDGDVFLLCSDGLWEYVLESEMERMLIASVSVSEWLKALEERVLMRGHAEQDNYSAIAVRCSDPDETTLFPG